MFVLWMFGRELEYQWGKAEFFRYYFLSGIGAGLITMLFNLHSGIPVVGASGAIYGLLLAYGLMYPNREILLYFIIPIKVKYFIIMLALVAFLASLSPDQSMVSHLTHLSGMAIGFLYLKSSLPHKSFKQWLMIKKLKYDRSQEMDEQKEVKRNESLMHYQIDKILDKLKESGWEGLNDSEKKFLHKASRKYSETQPPS